MLNGDDHGTLLAHDLLGRLAVEREDLGAELHAGLLRGPALRQEADHELAVIGLRHGEAEPTRDGLLEVVVEQRQIGADVHVGDREQEFLERLLVGVLVARLLGRLELGPELVGLGLPVDVLELRERIERLEALDHRVERFGVAHVREVIERGVAGLDEVHGRVGSTGRRRRASGPCRSRTSPGADPSSGRRR